MRESDEQFLERFMTEIQPSVQPLGRVTGVRLVEDPGGRRVRIEVGVDGRIGPVELILEGDTLLEAASGWEARVAEAQWRSRSARSSGPSGPSRRADPDARL